MLLPQGAAVSVIARDGVIDVFGLIATVRSLNSPEQLVERGERTTWYDGSVISSSEQSFVVA